MNRLRILKQRANRGGVGICKLADGWFVGTGRGSWGDCSGPHTRREALHVASRWAMPEKLDPFSITSMDEDAFQALSAWDDMQEEKQRYQEKVLAEVRSRVSEAVFKAILNYIGEADFLEVDELEIVDSPSGDLQDQGYSFGPFYISQVSVGQSGDSFAGGVAIPLPDGRYLSFSYSS